LQKNFAILGLAFMLSACGKTVELSSLPWLIWHAAQPGQSIEDLGIVTLEPSANETSPTLHRLAATHPGKTVFWELEARAAIAAPTSTRPHSQELRFDVWWRCTANSSVCTADAQPIPIGHQVVSLAANHSLSMNPNSDDSNNYTQVRVSGKTLALLRGGARGNLVRSIETAQFQQPRKLDADGKLSSPNLAQHISSTPGALLVSIAAAKPGTPSAAWVAMQIRISAFGNEVATEPPSQRLALRARLSQSTLAGTSHITLATVFVIVTWIAMLIWALQRSKQYPEWPPDDAPTRFGFLVCMLGCALPVLSLAFAFMFGKSNGGWYYICVGLLYA
jgi:hypothetical protein